MTDETTAAGAQSAPAAPALAEASAGGMVGQAAEGTMAQGALGAAIAGAVGTGEPSAGATSDPSAQALEEAWREQLVNDIVSRLQQKALAAAPPAASAPAAAPKPSPGRIVIFRDGTDNEYPAMITRVYPTGAVALFVFRDDSNSTHSYGAQMQIDPASEGVLGWFWPPRT